MKINKIIKRVVLSLFTLILVFTLFSSLNNKVNAAATLIEDMCFTLSVKGASVRTTGDKQGLRFECQCNIDDVGCIIDKFGLLIAYGTVEDKETIISAYENNTLINGYSILDPYVTIEGDDISITYYITVYDIPNTEYITNITVLPYLYAYNGEKNGDSVFINCYGDTVLYRNIASVTLSALNDGCTGDLLDIVKNYVNSNYKDVYTDSLSAYNVQSSISETKPVNLYLEFAKDFNECANDYILSTTNITDDKIYYNLTEQLINEEGKNWNQTDIFNFFYTYQSKWGWLLDYFDYCSIICKNDYLGDQIDICLGEISSIETYTWNNAKDLYKVLICFFTSQTSFTVPHTNNGTSYSSTTYSFPKENYGWIGYFNDKTIYRDLDVSELVKIGNTITIPAATTSSSSTLVTYTDKILHYSFLANSTTKVTSDDYYLCENTSTSATQECSAGDYSLSMIYCDIPSVTINGSGIDSTYLVGSTYICNITTPYTFTNLTVSDSFILNDMHPNDDRTYSESISFYNCKFTSESAKTIIELYNNCNISFSSCTFNLKDTTLLSIKKSANGTGESGDIMFDACTFNLTNSRILDIDYIPNGLSNTIHFNNCYINTEESPTKRLVNITEYTKRENTLIYFNNCSLNNSQLFLTQARTIVSDNIVNNYNVTANFDNDPQ